MQLIYILLGIINKKGSNKDPKEFSKLWYSKYFLCAIIFYITFFIGTLLFRIIFFQTLALYLVHKSCVYVCKLHMRTYYDHHVHVVQVFVHKIHTHVRKKKLHESYCTYNDQVTSQFSLHGFNIGILWLRLDLSSSKTNDTQRINSMTSESPVLLKIF